MRSLILMNTHRTLVSTDVLAAHLDDGSWVVVSEGLHPGDAVIAEPRTGLHAGQRIHITGEAAIGR